MPNHPGGRPFDEDGFNEAAALRGLRWRAFVTLRAVHERTPADLVEPDAILEAWLSLYSADSPLSHAAEVEIRFRFRDDDEKFRRELRRAKGTTPWRFVDPPDPSDSYLVEGARYVALHVAEYRRERARKPRRRGLADLAARADRMAVAWLKTGEDGEAEGPFAAATMTAARKRLSYARERIERDRDPSAPFWSALSRRPEESE